MGEHLDLALALEGRTNAARSQTKQLIALAGSLAALPEPEIDATFATALEASLLGEFDAQFSTRPQLTVVRTIPETPADEVVRRAPVVQMPRRRHVVRRSVVAVAAAASLAAFPLSAAASSLPGSALHGLKRGIEQSRLALFGTPLEDGFFHMELSHRRASELNQLIALGATSDRIAAAADMVDEEMRAGRALVFGNTIDPLDLSRLASMAQRTEVEMRKARAALEGGVTSALTPAIVTSEKIQLAVRDALGMTIASAPAPSDEQVVLGQIATQGPSTTTTETEPSGTTAADKDPGSSDDREPRRDDSEIDRTANNAKNGGCEVAGSAQGLGDVLAPITKVTCSD